MKHTINRQVHHLDARNQVLGRLATQAADLLRGKNKPEFVPYLDMGDTVIITYASEIRLTGRKMDNKIYYHHTGYPGGIRQETAAEVMAKDPTELIRKAISGMLPKNRLRQHWLRRLKIYAGEEK
jgi:large subunit ribosomal protein L13